MKNLVKLQAVKDKIEAKKPLSAQDQQTLKDHRVDAENIDFAFQSYYYKGANYAADCLLIVDEHILLIYRDGVRVEGDKWAIPGGFVDTEAKYGEYWRPGLETPLQAAIRELKEETNLDISGDALFVGVFEGNHRDPGDNDLAWSRTHAFLFDLKEVNLSDLEPKSDAKQVKFFPLNDLPELAFDHKEIIEYALQMRQKKKLSYK